MKGLILKDLLCLRKQLTNFCFVMAGVLIASIMYVLSARFGNMAKVGQEMLNGNATQVDVRNIGSVGLPVRNERYIDVAALDRQLQRSLSFVV